MQKQMNVFQKACGEIKRFLPFVALFSFCINMLMLVGPIYMLQIYDRVLSSGSLPTLFYLTLAACGLILVGAVLEGVRSRVLVRIAGRFDAVMNGPFFECLHKATLKNGMSQAQSLRDLEALRTFVTGPSLFFFLDAPWTPLFLIFIYLLHPLLFMVALGGALILFALAIASELVTRNSLAKAGASNAASQEMAVRALRNAETVEAMGMLPRIVARWQGQYDQALAQQATASDRAGVLTAMVRFVRPVLQVAILGVGAYLVLAQTLTPGAMIAASIMMGRALAPVEGAIGNWRSFIGARAAFNRIETLMSQHASDSSRLPLPRPNGELSIEKLVASVPASTVPIIKGISFGIHAGDLLGIVGPSAAGKSTLAKLMVGVWKASHGHVRLDGVDVGDWDPVELGPHIGYLPQDIELFDGTVAENIARFGDGSPEAIIDAAQSAGVHDLIVRLPNGYDTQLGPTGVTLSNGQRQRIGLARALYGDPAFIVLDEPNSNLDNEGDAALRAALTGLSRSGATVVVISHRPSILSFVDKILVLRDGTIERFGPRAQVLTELAVPRSRRDEAQPEVHAAALSTSTAGRQ